jgi:hypothetical protein
MSNKKLKYIYDNSGVGPKIYGTQLNFRTITRYYEDSNGNITEPRTFVYYTPKAGGRSSSGEVWKPGTEDSTDTFEQGGYILAAVTTDKGKTYSPRQYTQSDQDNGRIPIGKNVGDPILSNEAIASLNKPGSAIYEAIQTSVINTSVNTKPNLAPQLAARLSSAAGAPSPDGSVPTPDGSQPSPGSGGGTSDPVQLTDADSDPNSITLPTVPDSAYKAEDKKAKIGGKRLVYPINMRDEQDRIVFERYEYSPKMASDPTEQFTHLGTGPISVIQLPIQSGISDTNSVDWGGANLNPIEMFGVKTAMNLLDQGKKYSEVAVDALDEAQQALTSNKDLLKYYFAQEAVGVQGLLSRAAGSVLNPNLSLLFNGPSLRPFSFTFRLSPREEKESITVRQIIRQFKEASAVNTSSSDVFLKAPDVFKITYEQNGNPSASLNRFKTCALTSVSVNYTPDGTYMTYEDGTMTSYELSLTFNEIDPIYQINYKDLESDVIGY